MYFPYLRGRQFELIAIRELLERGLLSSNVVPVIEPIKATSTLRLTLEAFIERGRRIAVIQNPQVGNFMDEYAGLAEEDRLIELLQDDLVIQTHIMNPASERELHELREGTSLADLAIINTRADFLGAYRNLFSDEVPRYTLIPDDTTIRRDVRNNRVLFVDRFVREERNSDYQDRDIFFSEDHLYFNDEGYQGFSDYSIVGGDFYESGFAPYAVAIHIVYFSEDSSLYVKSYVSDSNDDISDPANKYYEALGHLVSCETIESLHTFGLSEFRRHREEGIYPGLGTVKKLAIMHHIELVGNFLEPGISG